MSQAPVTLSYAEPQTRRRWSGLAVAFFVAGLGSGPLAFGCAGLAISVAGQAGCLAEEEERAALVTLFAVQVLILIAGVWTESRLRPARDRFLGYGLVAAGLICTVVWGLLSASLVALFSEYL